MKKFAWVLLLCLPSYLPAAEGYKIIRPDGSVEFSDTPVKGAEKIQLPKAQGFQPTPKGTMPSTNGAKEKSKEAPADYQRFAITAPAAEETINYDEAGFSVSVAVVPGLKTGHQVVVYIDGQEVAKGSSTSFSVKAVDRGAHVLSAMIVDAGGARQQEAAAITFYVRQHSIIKPQGASPGGGVAPSQ